MQECDLVMKGGITSGVVYPHALVEISRHYRLKNIGGTSAGAIAATFGAAAEFRRQSGGGDAGFEAIAAVAGELGKDMRGLFQPSPRLKPLFDIMMASLSERARTKGKARTVLTAAAWAVKWRLLLTLVLIAGVIALADHLDNGWIAAFGILATILLLIGWIGWSLYRIVAVHLPVHNFGICTGRTVNAAGSPKGFTDWMADKIDQIAGRDPDGEPLTVGELEARGIKVATMTSDLSTGRPYQLPLRTRIHYFNEAEFRRLFAPRIVDYLVRAARKPEYQDPGFTPDDGWHPLPSGADFPVLLVARLSLSFPILIEAVPLWRRDFGLPDRPLRRCLFSDGGISSNFPIHFFDEMMPTRPTFGIALADWEEERHAQREYGRIAFPSQARQSTNLPIRDIGSLGGFLSAILGTAKDWQDSLQSMLPGYAERIVTVLLDPSREGGLNLAMDEPTIDALSGYGQQAGRALVERFSYRDAAGGDRPVSGFDQHRYARAISLLPKLEVAIHNYTVAMEARPAGAGPDSLTGSAVLTEVDPKHYSLPKGFREGPLTAFSDKIAAAGAGDRQLIHDRLPVADARVRLQADADRLPRPV